MAQYLLEVAHWPEHTNDCSTRVDRDAMTIALIIAFSVLGVGMVLLVYGTVVKNRWGVNLMPVSCPRCNIPLPQIRQPKTVRQVLWGGGTCAACGTEVDKWGRELTSQRRTSTFS